jgi:hypothetical protein
MSRRSDAERKSREIEEELRRQSEIDQGQIEAVIKTSEAAARFEEERKARIAVEQAKAETDERFRRIEEKYKVEMDEIRAELEDVAAAARQAEKNHRQAEEKHRQAEEKHRDEITRITAEAESRAHQAEANARQQYQIKVEEAIATAQTATFNLEETRKKLSEAETNYREMENIARQAETRWRRLYLILKLSLSSAEQIIAETHNADDDAEKDAMVIPLELPTEAYLGNFSAETPGSAANGLMEFEDFPFSERMRALFEAAARANAPDDKNG